MVLYCTSLLLGVLIAAVQVHGQLPSTDSFISIDCGSTDNYTDSATRIPYTTDENFIDTGTNHKVSSTYINSSLPKQYETVRSFPNGGRNCYTLRPAIKDSKYLLRAGFMYGNYDRNNSVKASGPLLFDLYIGVNLWKTVSISDTSSAFTYEAMAIALFDFVSVCLIKTGSSTPFISLLEMRQLKSRLYPTLTSPYYIVFSARINFGATTDNIIRYPDDPYDRIWKPMNITNDVLTTTSKVNNSKNDAFEVPSAVHQTAAVSANINESVRFYWDSESSSGGEPHYYVNLHFSEFERLPEKDIREFSIYVNGVLRGENYSPPYLMSDYLYADRYNWETAPLDFLLNATKNATRPPLINAVEVYSLWSTGGVSMTHTGDVEGIWKIKETYTLKRNWVGDPCLPEQYAWDGVSCGFRVNDFRVIALNLSSSGLVGEVATSFSNLTAIQFLDLSYNNLSGKIPDSLATILSLQVLNLTGNCITDVPKGLVEKSKNGSLILRFDNNSSTCNGSKPTPSGIPPPGSNSTAAENKKITTPIIIVLSVVPAILLLVVVVLILWRTRRKTQAVNHDVVQPPLSRGWQFNMDHGGSQLPYPSHKSSVDHKDRQLPSKSRQFMYTELEDITKKFSHTLGKGGFGTVFHGSLEDGTEVAVKMCSLSSEQALNLFSAEVENLSRVRHKNLVSLVGYCMDRGQLAVVYEYMPLGSLEDHLRGKAGNGRALSWAERLQIVIDAAQGLDYLYNGCPVPIIHRDIKTSNILLGQNLVGKVSDFGFSKAFHSDLQTHVSVQTIAYTPGYIDPMCFKSGRFSEKTDVYSFGVVLLEIITGEPPIQHNRDVRIIEHVQLSFEAGDINAIVDARLQGMYNTESVWKVSELAMRCTARAADQRPNMSEVVMQLRESLGHEIIERSKSTTTESEGMSLMKEPTVPGPSAR